MLRKFKGYGNYKAFAESMTKFFALWNNIGFSYPAGYVGGEASVSTNAGKLAIDFSNVAVFSLNNVHFQADIGVTLEDMLVTYDNGQLIVTGNVY